MICINPEWMRCYYFFSSKWARRHSYIKWFLCKANKIIFSRFVEYVRLKTKIFLLQVVYKHIKPRNQIFGDKCDSTLYGCYLALGKSCLYNNMISIVIKLNMWITYSTYNNKWKWRVYRRCVVYRDNIIFLARKIELAVAKQRRDFASKMAAGYYDAALTESEGT